MPPITSVVTGSVSSTSETTDRITSETGKSGTKRPHLATKMVNESSKKKKTNANRATGEKRKRAAPTKNDSKKKSSNKTTSSSSTSNTKKASVYNITLLNGSTYSIAACKTDTIASLKTKIQVELQVPLIAQWIIINGSLQDNDDSICTTLGVEFDSTIHLAIDIEQPTINLNWMKDEIIANVKEAFSILNPDLVQLCSKEKLDFFYPYGDKDNFDAATGIEAIFNKIDEEIQSKPDDLLVGTGSCPSHANSLQAGCECCDEAPTKHALRALLNCLSPTTDLFKMLLLNFDRPSFCAKAGWFCAHK